MKNFSCFINFHFHKLYGQAPLGKILQPEDIEQASLHWWFLVPEKAWPPAEVSHVYAIGGFSGV